MTEPQTDRRAPPTKLAITLWVITLVALAVLWSIPYLRAALRQDLSRASMDPTCDVRETTCVARFDDGTEVALRVTEVEDDKLRFDVDSTLRPKTLELTGVDMPMGLFRVGFEPGRAAVETTLPACSRERMRWQADLLFEDRVATFELDVEQGELPARYRR